MFSIIIIEVHIEAHIPGADRLLNVEDLSDRFGGKCEHWFIIGIGGEGIEFFRSFASARQEAKNQQGKKCGFHVWTLHRPSTLCDKKEEGSGITRRIRVVSMKRDPAAFIRHSSYLTTIASHA